ncbi:MAG: hypothetical protein AAF530_13885 [Pseudomonadota bacterium]
MVCDHETRTFPDLEKLLQDHPSRVTILTNPWQLYPEDHPFLRRFQSRLKKAENFGVYIEEVVDGKKVAVKKKATINNTLRSMAEIAFNRYGYIYSNKKWLPTKDLPHNPVKKKHGLSSRSESFLRGMGKNGNGLNCFDALLISEAFGLPVWAWIAESDEVFDHILKLEEDQICDTLTLSTLELLGTFVDPSLSLTFEAVEPLSEGKLASSRSRRSILKVNQYCEIQLDLPRHAEEWQVLVFGLNRNGKGSVAADEVSVISTLGLTSGSVKYRERMVIPRPVDPNVKRGQYARLRFRQPGTARFLAVMCKSSNISLNRLPFMAPWPHMPRRSNHSAPTLKQNSPGMIELLERLFRLPKSDWAIAGTNLTVIQ